MANPELFPALAMQHTRAVLRVAALSGQNPNLSGQPDCGVISPYLAGA